MSIVYGVPLEASLLAYYHMIIYAILRMAIIMNHE